MQEFSTLEWFLVLAAVIQKLVDGTESGLIGCSLLFNQLGLHWSGVAPESQAVELHWLQGPKRISGAPPTGNPGKTSSSPCRAFLLSVLGDPRPVNQAHGPCSHGEWRTWHTKPPQYKQDDGE